MIRLPFSTVSHDQPRVTYPLAIFCMPMPLVMALAYGSLEKWPRRLLPSRGTLGMLVALCWFLLRSSRHD